VPEKRIIIGETEHAGLPISQPAAANAGNCPLRFVQHGQSFTLEALDLNFSKEWVEVPVVQAKSVQPAIEPSDHDGPRQTRCCLSRPILGRCVRPINHHGACQFQK
jgi:hypothetical protein